MDILDKGLLPSAGTPQDKEHDARLLGLLDAVENSLHIGVS